MFIGVIFDPGDGVGDSVLLIGVAIDLFIIDTDESLMLLSLFQLSSFSGTVHISTWGGVGIVNFVSLLIGLLRLLIGPSACISFKSVAIDALSKFVAPLLLRKEEILSIVTFCLRNLLT